MNKIKIIFGLIISMSVFTANAANVSNAFGLSVGQQVNTSQMQASSGFGGDSINSGPATYAFTPSLNDMQVNFNEYSFSTDNSRKFIASVMAIKNSGSEKQCQSDLNVIKAAAIKKYGEPNYNQVNMVNFTDTQNKSKTLTISCAQNILTFVLNDVGAGLKF